jgi:ribosomal protein L37AE/L43A
MAKSVLQNNRFVSRRPRTETTNLECEVCGVETLHIQISNNLYKCGICHTIYSGKLIKYCPEQNTEIAHNKKDKYLPFGK